MTVPELLAAYTAADFEALAKELEASGKADLARFALELSQHQRGHGDTSTEETKRNWLLEGLASWTPDDFECLANDCEAANAPASVVARARRWAAERRQQSFN